MPPRAVPLALCLLPFLAGLAPGAGQNSPSPDQSQGAGQSQGPGNAEAAQRCLARLREGFASDEFWPAMHAAEGLTRAGFGADVRDALTPRLAIERDDQRRCGLARELVRAGALDQARVLREVLANPDPFAHAHACESLFKVRQGADPALLRRASAQTDRPGLAIMASAALARAGEPQAIGRIRTFVQSQDPLTARIAAWALARTGDRGDVPALRAAVQRATDPLLRAYLEHALAALGDPDGLRALENNLSHPSPDIRVSAAEFAPDARAVGARARLLTLLDDPNLDVRIRAADASLRLQP